jgi:hypothetical protein
MSGSKNKMDEYGAVQGMQFTAKLSRQLVMKAAWSECKKRWGNCAVVAESKLPL